jgi:hypothetical protein
LASSRANKLISNASRRRCSPDIARYISSWTACAAGLVSVWSTERMVPRGGVPGSSECFSCAPIRTKPPGETALHSPTSEFPQTAERDEATSSMNP